MSHFASHLSASSSTRSLIERHEEEVARMQAIAYFFLALFLALFALISLGLLVHCLLACLSTRHHRTPVLTNAHHPSIPISSVQLEFPETSDISHYSSAELNTTLHVPSAPPLSVDAGTVSEGKTV